MCRWINARAMALCMGLTWARKVSPNSHGVETHETCVKACDSFTGLCIGCLQAPLWFGAWLLGSSLCCVFWLMVTCIELIAGASLYVVALVNNA
jgi:hypothetical protein